jgi:amino acid adenylation domain-containing protein
LKDSSNQLIHESFLARTAENSSAIALMWDGKTMTYGELAQRSAILRRRLRAAGVGRETLVGNGADRGPGLILGILAVMRAGGAWLPLDSSYPQARLSYLVKDSGIRLMLRSGGSWDRLTSGLQLMDVDSNEDMTEESGEQEPEISAHHLAYVIYTSGSTGKPKGVLVEHASMAAMVAGIRQFAGVQRGDRVLQFASPNFDVSIGEIGVALTSGATLVLADKESLLPGPGFVHLLEQNQVNVLLIPPSVLAAVPSTSLPSLHTVICAGEALPAKLAEIWGKNRRLINAYGPTEAAIYATAALVPGDGSKPTIGRPLVGAQVSIVDENLQPVLPGEVGELLIGGAGVARGYLNRPELTTEKFIRDRGGNRHYRSGDLVQMLPNGEIDFIGRADDQIKLHGYRIELGEIAEVLRSYPGVRDAIVVVRQQRLAGYVVSNLKDSAPIKAWCAEKLPGYMVPANIAIMAEFPLNPSGKIDRSRLPEFDRVSAGLSQVPSAARTPTEQAAIEAIRNLLGIAEVGANDDFFKLGGHSLLVGRLVARLRSQFQIDLPLVAIYRAPTVAEIAALIDGKDTGDMQMGPPCSPPLRPMRRDQPIPLSFPQERIWYLDKLAAHNRAYQFQATFRMRGPLNYDVLTEALNEVIRRHEIFRTRFVENDGRPVQQPVPPMRVEVPLIDLSEFPAEQREAERQRVISTEMSKKIEAWEPPLVRWVLLREEPERHTLFHIEHHLVHDGWSFAVFIDELVKLYDACLKADPSSVPEPALQFADFAAWQRNWLTGDNLARFVDHWTKLLAGAPIAIELPTDRPRPSEFSFQGDAVRIEFPPAEYSMLQTAARTHGVTLFTLMLSGFIALVSRYADQSDLVLGVGVANRRMEESERLIGMVVNTMPMRVQLSDDLAFNELVHRVHRIAVEGYEWQDIPLDALVDALAIPRSLARNPLMSVFFSFHDAAVPDIRLGQAHGDVRIEHNGTAKTDLNVVVVPRAEQRVGRASSEEDQALYLIWEFSTDLFDRATMEQMVAAYRRLLVSAIANPSLTLSRLDIHAEHLTQALEPKMDSRPSLEEMVDRWVREKADMPAVSHGNAKLSYRDLDRRARALSGQLAALGAGPATPVAVLLERGVDMIVAMLASLRAKAPCLLVDPESSAAEIQKTIAGAVVCLSEAFRQQCGEARVAVMSGSDDFGGNSVTETPVNSNGLESISRVVHFTSPERQATTEQALVLMVNALEKAGFPSSIAQASGVVSPLFLIEVWGTLARGGTLYVVSGRVSDPTRLSHALATELNQGDSFGIVVPGPVARFIAARHPEALARSQALLMVGAEADWQTIRRLRSSVHPTRVLAALGTPNFPLALWHEVGERTSPDAVLSESWAVQGVTARVKDRHGAALPPGIPGTLYLGLAGTGTLIQTGWRARHRRDGKIDLLGQSHEWPLTRGYRVSLPEVQAAIKEHPDVEDAMAVVHDGVLTNYFTSRPGSITLEPEVLRGFLADRLPSYAVPAAHVPVTAFPLDKFGEVDISVLCIAKESLAATQAMTPMQGQIADLFAKVLGCEAGLHDDFFEMGGRSLLAIQLVAQMNRESSVNLSIARFLRNPSVAAVASAVEELRSSKGSPLYSSLKRKTRQSLAVSKT